MKKIAILTFIIFYTFSVFSQETSIVNLGFGYPFFFSRNFNEASGGTHYIGHERINAFVELPQLIKFRKNPNFSVTTGFGYFHFNENESGGGNGGGRSYTLKHDALSIYAKLNYSISNPQKSFRWYAGTFSGFYVYSNTSGDVNWWMMQQGGNRYGEYEIDQNGKSFFNNFYTGFYAGFKIKTRFENWLQPAFEFSFLPGYASITDKFLTYEGKDTSTTKSMVLMSVILGIGKKKATRINE